MQRYIAVFIGNSTLYNWDFHKIRIQISFVFVVLVYYIGSVGIFLRCQHCCSA